MIAWMPRPRAAPQHAVHDRHDVGQTLARTGAGREHIVLPLMRLENRFALMSVQEELPAAVILERLAIAEYPRAFVRKTPSATRSSMVPPGSNAGFSLQQRLRPEALRSQVAVDELHDPRISDPDKAPRVIPVVVDQPIPEFEHVHVTPPGGGRWISGMAASS